MSDTSVYVSGLPPDYATFVLLYAPLYQIMHFKQFKCFLINLLLTTCILRYVLLLDVLIDICFVFTIYLINLVDTNRRYNGYCFFNQVTILWFCIFKSLIGTDMTYINLALMCR